MRTPDPDKLARLPKWARDHITGAEAHIVHLEGRRDALAGSPEGRIVVVGNEFIDGFRPAVPNDFDTVTWRLDPNSRDHVSVSYTPASESPDSLPCVTIRTGRRLVLRPHMSNVISLRCDTDEELSDQRDRYHEAYKRGAGL
jgi:hypothetical protein